MEELFQIARNTAENNKLSESEVLSNHINEIFDLIVEKHQQNILIAAGVGSFEAILCIFTNNAMYRGIVDINRLFYPTEKLYSKLHEYEILDLQKRLEKQFQPFRLSLTKERSCNILKIHWD